MTWEENYQGHELWSSLRDLTESLNEAIAEGNIEVSDDRVQRLNSVVSYASAYEGHPHVLITQAALNRARDRVKAITAAVPSVDQIYHAPSGNSPSNFVSLVNELRQWPQTGSVNLRGLTKEVEQLSSLIEGLHQHATAVQESISAEAEKGTAVAKTESSKALESLQAEAKTVKEDLSATSDQVTELSKNISEERSRIDDAVRSHQESFEQGQTDRSEKFREWLDKIDSDRAYQKETLEAQSNELVAYLEGAKEKVDTILGVVGERSIATDYGRWAEKQKTRATIWSVVAVLCFLLAGGVFAASAFNIFGTRPANGVVSALWQHTFAHFGMTAVLLGAAVYAVTRSNQHWQEEKDAKARQLVLTTLEPYLVNLEDEDQREVRQEVARAMFVVQARKGEQERRSSLQPGLPGRLPDGETR